jgi:hypothetical protein
MVSALSLQGAASGLASAIAAKKPNTDKTFNWT